jgi:Centromere-binding protein ParB C-terminal
MPGRVQVPSTHQGSVLDALIGAAPSAAQLERPAAPEPAGSKQEKLPAYAPHWLIERLRNAVVALQRMPGAEADAPATLSELCQTACLREVQRLEAQYNDGAPFPARVKRKLRTGPPIQ